MAKKPASVLPDKPSELRKLRSKDAQIAKLKAQLSELKKRYHTQGINFNQVTLELVRMKQLHAQLKTAGRQVLESCGFVWNLALAMGTISRIVNKSEHNEDRKKAYKTH